MKKLNICILTFFAMMLFGVMAGCSSDDSTSEKTSSSSEQDDSSSDSKISGELEIQYFVGGYGDEWWKEVINDFEEEYPDVTVIQQAGPNVNKEMQTRWISGDPPDFAFLGGDGMSETKMVEDDQLMDITDWVEEVELEDGTSLIDEFVAPPNKYEDNKIYSIPFIFDTWGIWYDKTWFEEEGFEVPDDFESWMSSMEEIQKNAGISPFTTTGMYPYYFLKGTLFSGIGSVGGDELLDDVINGVEGAWSSDEVLSVLEKVQKIRDAGYIDPGFAGINHTQSQMNFLNHQNAYIPVGFFLPNEMAGDVPDDFEFGFIPPPLNESDKPMVLIPKTGTYGIAKDAKNPEAAKAFGKFILSKQNAAKFAEMAGGLPNVKGVDIEDNPDVPQYLKDVNSFVNDPEKVTLHYLPHSMSNDFRNPLGDALVSFLLGEIDSQEFTEKAEEAAEKYRGD